MDRTVPPVLIPRTGFDVSYRLLVLDVDGTLLDSHHQLRPRVAAAVRAAGRSGLRVVLATGKLLGSVRPMLDIIGVHGPQIVLNGAATVESDSGTALRVCPLRDDDRRTVLTLVRELDPSVLISQFALDAIYMDREHPRIGIFAEYGEAAPLLVPDLLTANLPPAAKILLSGPPERLAALRAAITPLLGGRVNIVSTTHDFLEFFDPQASKGPALAALREQLGVTRNETIAFGDGENDLPLLSEAGLAVAMGNAAAVTRAAAQRIAPTSDEEGVAVVLEELLAEWQR
jgi:Cof subfamily protein (haloacid dehalogenase superfamily)